MWYLRSNFGRGFYKEGTTFMIAAAQSSTLLSFATILTVATAAFTVVFAAVTWVLIRHKERHAQAERRTDANVRADAGPGTHSGKGAPASPVPAIRLRDTLAEAMDQQPADSGRGRTIGRTVLILLLAVAPLIVGAVVLVLTTH